jgi:hypothetical protein
VTRGNLYLAPASCDASYAALGCSYAENRGTAIGHDNTDSTSTESATDCNRDKPSRGDVRAEECHSYEVCRR